MAQVRMICAGREALSPASFLPLGLGEGQSKEGSMAEALTSLEHRVESVIGTEALLAVSATQTSWDRPSQNDLYGHLEVAAGHF